MTNLPYTNLQIEDLPNEIWVDALEYDGFYEVSNLGRIKSCAREVNTKWGTSRMKKAKIRKQSLIKDSKGRGIGLNVTFMKKTFTAQSIIFKSFYPHIDFEENECIMHISKNLLDNRLENLKKVTWSVSKNTDMIKSIPTILATPLNLQKANEKNKIFYENRTHKECSGCGKIDLVENFEKDKSVCKNCINKYWAQRRKKHIYKNEEKSCVRCHQIKNDIDFPKADNMCKKCRYELHKKYIDEQRKNLGDFYVKQYGQFNYGIKEFDQKIIDKLRNEIIEKRKPRHCFDGKEFVSTEEFAKYIYEKYKIPITTTKKRIVEGRSEYECSLTRKEFMRYNLNKKKSDSI
jgi:hypothetical protein